MKLDVQRGCRTGALAEEPINTKIGKLPRCPKAMIQEDLAWAFNLYRDWTFFKHSGVMPDAGGRHDQSALFIDAVDVIEAEIFEIKKEAESDGS